MSSIAATSLSPKEPRPEVFSAARISGPGELEIVEMPMPQSPAGEVRIRVEGSGICASNLEVWKGQPWFEYPLEPGAPGHEGWGTVDSADPGTPDIRVGDRVAFLSSHAYGQYDIARSDQVIKLPEELENKPFPAEAIGCAMNIFRRSDIKPGHEVAIVGAGFLGLLLTQLASGAGARVIAVSRRQFALETAKQCGAAETIVLDENSQIINQVKDFTGGRLCDRVIEAVGNQQALDLSAELSAERGRLMIAGYHQDGPRQVNMWLWNWRGLDVINTHERDPRVYVEGMRMAVDAVLHERIDPFALLTHRYSLESLDQGLNDVRDRPDGFIKGVLVV